MTILKVIFILWIIGTISNALSGSRHSSRSRRRYRRRRSSYSNSWHSDHMDTPSIFNDGFTTTKTNPANGLPMVGAVDVKGNPYGTDSAL